CRGVGAGQLPGIPSHGTTGASPSLRGVHGRIRVRFGSSAHGSVARPVATARSGAGRDRAAGRARRADSAAAAPGRSHPTCATGHSGGSAQGRQGGQREPRCLGPLGGSVPLACPHPHRRPVTEPLAGDGPVAGVPLRVSQPAGGELRHRRSPRRGCRLPGTFRPPGQSSRRVAASTVRGCPGGVVVTEADALRTPERRELRETVRRFTETEVLPELDQWERDGELPRNLHRKAGDLGLLGGSFPEFAGGGGGDFLDTLIVTEELHYAGGSGGVIAALLTCGIAVPHIVDAAQPYQLERWARPALAGGKIGALAVTEPDGGSDVAAIRTTAVREGDEYVVN